MDLVVVVSMGHCGCIQNKKREDGIMGAIDPGGYIVTPIRSPEKKGAIFVYLVSSPDLHG